MLAPIIVFAYNRPDHLKTVLEALAKNMHSKDSELFIFIDGPKNEKGIVKNELVLKTAQMFQAGYFKNVTINNHEKNRGLAKSVISGVSEVIEKYGRAIIVEDDSVPAPMFLDFMNKALDTYEDDLKVWSVGGFTLPFDLPEGYDRDVIFTQRCSSCAWGTWKDRWEKIDWAMTSYGKFRFNLIKRAKFNKWGKDKASMLDDQMNGRIDSWAIRFDYEMFRHNALNVIPAKSLIKQIGFDGSGTHTGKVKEKAECFGICETEQSKQFVFPKPFVDEEIFNSFNKYANVKRYHLIKRYFGNLLYSIKKGKK